jgi:asparagine synthetase B (glutamine-hydrolysing)
MILELRRHLYQAVLKRTQSDVPFGVYLSGGLDSAVIAGILADMMKSKAMESPPPSPGGQTRPPFTCFCVGFQADTEFDEMRKTTSAMHVYMEIADRGDSHCGAHG